MHAYSNITMHKPFLYVLMLRCPVMFPDSQSQSCRSSDQPSRSAQRRLYSSQNRWSWKCMLGGKKAAAVWYNFILTIFKLSERWSLLCSVENKKNNEMYSSCNQRWPRVHYAVIFKDIIAHIHTQRGLRVSGGAFCVSCINDCYLL